MSNPSPAISVLMPVYNVERLLPRCLDSLLSQTFKDFEIVAVNDASPDGSAAVLADYAGKYDFIRVISKEQNEGSMMARQTACDAARGQYLFFIDSDDYLPADALEVLYAQATATDADITLGDLCMVNAAGRKVLRNRNHRAGTTWHTFLRSILHWNIPSLCGALFNRRLFEGHKFSALMHQRHSEDRILLTEILVECRPSIAVVDAVTYYYWINSESVSRARPDEKSVRNQFGALFLCFDYVEKHCPELHADNCNFIIRFLGLWVEKGVERRLLCDCDSRVDSLLRFSTMRRYTGTRFALHTWQCMHTPLYRSAMHGLRNVIRRLQGKD